MSTQAGARAIRSVIEAAKAAWTDYTLLVDYDNRDPVDLAALTDPYVCVDILWLDGEQMDMGTSPLTTKYGQIILAAGVKEGAGTDLLLKLLDHMERYLQLRDDIGASVRTQAASLTKPRTLKGFYYQPLIVPFWMTVQSPTTP